MRLYNNKRRLFATIKSVILDYGLVLCRAPQSGTIDQIAQMFRVDSETFWSLYERNRAVYDRGELSSQEYWQRFAEDAGTKLHQNQIQWLRKCDIEMWSDLEERMLVWVHELRAAGYKTSVLSNLNKEFAEHIRTRCHWIERFDVPVFSAELGRIKPEPEIYRHCLQLLECSAEEAIFIDDREANVYAAQKEGIASLLYRSTDQLRLELKLMGFGVLPSHSNTTGAAQEYP